MASETSHPQPTLKAVLEGLENPSTKLDQAALERLQAAQDAVAKGIATEADNTIVYALSLRLGDPFDF